MATEKVSVSMDAWILQTARQHAEAQGLSLSAFFARGVLREIAAGHSSSARAALYGADAVVVQEADERIVAEDIARAADERRSGEAA
ncbi:hypothetical protein ABZ897_59715 [Nonomuraea sp. NPDC046802]|uniref:hypothetical protein n=1 Tax=Nonomuraea sp. NPDC046802 TaxID=3154919 RepID=UPI0033DC011E